MIFPLSRRVAALAAFAASLFVLAGPARADRPPMRVLLPVSAGGITGTAALVEAATEAAAQYFKTGQQRYARLAQKAHITLD